VNQFLEKIYSKSPVWAQNMEMTAFGLYWYWKRFGKWFRREYPNFIAREYYSAEQWNNYQTQSLRNLLKYAVKYVPHYGKTLGGNRDFDNFRIEDLASLPFVTKEMIRKNPDSFVSVEIPKSQIKTSQTSGTTGTPLSIKHTDKIYQTWMAACEARLKKWAGLNYRMSRVMIGGRIVVPSPEAPQNLMSLVMTSQQKGQDWFAYGKKVLNNFRGNY
jgi:phenylacetate-CoA ligase